MRVFREFKFACAVALSVSLFAAACVDLTSGKNTPLPASGNEIYINWTANREKAVNSAGGGYRVHYSNMSGFDVSVASYVDVPYTSGSSAPTSATLRLASGTYYLKVVAYSALNSTGSNASSQVKVIVP